MKEYVDGYVLPVRNENLPAYRRLARTGAHLWRKHGAVDCHECIGADIASESTAPFPQQRLKLEPNETAVLSWIVFKSRAHRDRVNARVMNDPQLAELMDAKTIPFDSQRMVYVGFELSEGA